jgi:hypothetical protein
MTSAPVPGVARRAVMRGVNGVLAMLVAFVFALGPIGTFFARRAVVMLRIGTPETIWKGPIPMLLGIAGTFVYALPFACLLVALVEPVAGASPGGALFGVRSNADRDERWRRAIVAAIPWWGLTVALVIGSWQIAVVALIAWAASFFARATGRWSVAR